MSTDLISLNYGSNDTLSSLTGTSSTTTSTSTSATTDTTSTTGTFALSGDEKKFSKGAAMMQKLSELQKSDPEKFKQVAQSISDKLSTAAKNSSDSKASEMYSKMADKFAAAAKSGDMSSLTPPSRPAEANGTAGTQSQAAMKYAQANGSDNPMETVDGIISGALSGVGTTEA